MESLVEEVVVMALCYIVSIRLSKGSYNRTVGHKGK